MIPKKESLSSFSTLTDEQNSILSKAISKDRPNIFFTGQAGTGKSFLLNKIISSLHDLESDSSRIAATASTGIAALKILDGKTFYSWAGFSPDTSFNNIRNVIQSLRRNRAAFRRWKQVKTLIIDECSMLSPLLLDRINEIAKIIRYHKKSEPFGGIQLILCGDFYQLPPVSKYKGKFCFDADCWDLVVGGTNAYSNAYELTQVFRQAKDLIFIEVLNYLRTFRKASNSHFPDDSLFPVIDALFHHLSLPFDDRPNDPIFRQLASSSFKTLEDLKKYVTFDSALGCHIFEYSEEEVQKFKDPSSRDQGYFDLLAICNPIIKPVPLYSTKKESDSYNDKCSGSLTSYPIYSYEALYFKTECNKKKKDHGQLTISSLPNQLKLRVGTQVMLLKNLNSSIGLVNGSLGIVEGFVSVNTDSISIKGSQPIAGGAKDGKTIFLPRVRFPVSSVEYVEECSKRKINYSFLSPEFNEETTSLSIVIFPTMQEVSNINDSDESDEDPLSSKSNEELYCKVQLPLMQSWSYTIHKSQGQTLRKVVLDINSVFEHGQFYVGLSRGVSLSSIQLIGYDEYYNDKEESVRSRIWKLMRHERVEKFYQVFKNQQKK